MQYSIKAQETADQLKALLNDILIDAHLKQEIIAHQGGVKQCTVSQWFNPESDRNFPAFQLFLQPASLVLPICNSAISRFGKKIVENEFDLPTNGAVDDNLLNIDMIQGDLIRKKEKDPKAALRYCDDLIREAMIMKRELELKIEQR
ncbi:MAG: hypothetical protein WAV48_04510 [Candidatus Magasanikiibacteriota bacterium]